jgi:4-azaleucine resistance transporter AzlC
MSEKTKQFWAGIQAEFPLLVGVFPFGMIYGALALNAGLSKSASQMMSSIVFAGSSQFVTTQLVHDSAPGFVIVLTIAVVNLRHILYSASLAPYLASVSMRWKTLLSYLLTDEAYAPTVIKYEREGVQPFSHWFLFGAGLALWSTWQVSTALGIFLGTAIPESWSLDFALPLTFIAMVVPVLKGRPYIAAALSAGCGLDCLLIAIQTWIDPCGIGGNHRWNLSGGERMNIWLVMLFGGLITFGMRFSLIYLFGRFQVPETMRRALHYVPPAVLSAIIFPELFLRDGSLDISMENTRLLAGLASVLVAWFSKNTLITIIAGMVALFLLQYFL